MPQSPELAGGEGFTFEGDVVAFYLVALLAEAYAPGVDDRTVIRVSVQQRDFGEPLDDVIVDFEDTAKNPARLSLQVKRTLTISKADTNTDFRDIIRDCWHTLAKSDFRHGTDRYGTAVGTVSTTKERALKTLCDWARESLTTVHFDARFDQEGNASKDLKAVKNDVVSVLNDVNGKLCTNVEVHRFLAHFVLIQFDLLREGATDPPDAINRIRDCLATDDVGKAPLVWSRVVQLARASAGKSGQFDRARLVHFISPIARLRGATSFRFNLDKLTEIATSYAYLIPDDVGGARLNRALLLENLETKLSCARVVQIRGLPGSGKSVLVRRAVQQALDHGPVLFLKAEQLEGTSWISYANAQGLLTTKLDQFLLEIGAVGTPIVFIDAIDRIEKEHQPIILDVIRAIIESPLLDNWRIVASLRDNGIDVLRNWLGNYLDVLKVETLDVGQLSDEDAEILAEAKPHLRPLLFGSDQVQGIVRRPFFANVLNQSCVADPTSAAFAPQTEIDLIENWWRRGGYNETGQSTIERQRTLIDLARVRARQLSQPIGLSQLTALAHIDNLRVDGILQNSRDGISVRFAHDIFFEWAFFHLLADRSTQWMEEIKACGEPPAVARVVELASQWEYTKGNDWPKYLTQTERTDLRSQWQRAWLLGPLGSAAFEVDDSKFAAAVFADDFRHFRKVLIWFQAEKTTPNATILAGALPLEQRQRFADLLGWPSDFLAWQRLIDFILRRVADIPQRLYPDVVAIFVVWQNAYAGFRNPTSRAILQQCAKWLTDIDALSVAEGPDENSEYWGKVPELAALSKSLGQLLMRSSRAEPSLAGEHIRRAINSERIRDDEFQDIIAYSPILAQSLPELLVDLSLAFLRKELPDEQVAREERELRAAAAHRKAILAKPEADRSSKEQMSISIGRSIQSVGDFDYHDWEQLSIHNDHRSFNSPSPLREPFYSLFQSSPDEALRLLRDLSNHAINAWHQLHRYSHDREDIPIALELKFPWCTQKFWGTDREYLWCRSVWAPDAIGCGYMALEEWCFSELEHGRPVDELIEKIVNGNECIAILGIASMIALHTETVSEVTLPLITSQRLLTADHNRMVQDFSPTASLIGFTNRTDKSHVEAIQAANSRPVRKQELSGMVPRFVFAKGSLHDRAREAILNFKNDLPYQYEELRNVSREFQRLTNQAMQYAELADPKNYQAYRTTEDSDQITIVHTSPSAALPENVAKVEEALKRLRQMNLWTWASKSFEEKAPNCNHSVESAIAMAQELDVINLFKQSNDEQEEDLLGMHRSAVVATAAIALNFRGGLPEDTLDWARDVLGRAMRLPEKRDMMWSSGSVIPWHHGIYVARGLAADIREGTATDDAARDLLGLVAHSLEIVSLAAFEEACKLWPKDSKLTWAALILALSLCHVPLQPRNRMDQHSETADSSIETQTAIDAALSLYEARNGWASLPLPPPAWVKAELGAGDSTSTADVWVEPSIYWRSKYAAEILNRVPFEEIIGSSARSALLHFLANVLDWTNKKNSSPGVNPGRRDHSTARIFELTYALGSRLGHLAGLLPLHDFQIRFLDPILALEDDKCWTLLFPFTSTYICSYIYDATVVPADAVTILHLCLERLLKASTFKRNTYRSGEFSGYHQPKLVDALMFVSVERADLATRYVNGDWSEISIILPLIDRFIRAGGWAASVMDPFLTLCERARAHYPAEAFADQVLSIVSNGSDNLKGWHRSSIPSRIAELVQYFANRDVPMNLVLAQKFLRILDMLVDMGDRRSAALQLGEAFREIRAPF